MTHHPFLLLGLFFCIGIQAARADHPVGGYSFGIGPTQKATELAKRWTRVMHYLSEKSGVPLAFKTAKDIPAFQQKMQAGTYDFIYVNPYHYVQQRKAVGYSAFAREKDGKLFGVLVVKKDGPIQNVAQLNGQTLAFPAPSALAATWLPLSMLKEKGVQVTPQYVTSMDSVYLVVAKGLLPAGGGEMRTLGALDPTIRNQLRVIWTSVGLPPFAFAAHPRVPKSIVARVQKAIDEMDQNREGLALLKSINFKGMEIATDMDYSGLRRLNIQPIEATGLTPCEGTLC